MIYDNIEDVPDDTIKDIVEGVMIAGKKLREWRAFGEFHEMRAQILSADGPVTIICHHDDRISFFDGDEGVDITKMIDGDAT